MIPSIILNSVISIMLYFVLIPFNLNKELMKISIINFVFILIISYPIISFLESYGAVLILTISDLLFMLMYLHIIFQNKLLKN
jgi:O-antigen/teichoic acid export membrane protein